MHDIWHNNLWNVTNPYLHLIFETIISTFFLLLSEFIFKAFFRAKNDSILSSNIIAYVVRFFYGIFSYIATFFVDIAEWILKYIFNVKLRNKKEAFSKIDLEHFVNQSKNHDEEDIDEGGNVIKWIIRENPKWGVKGISRNNSTVQKSWAIIEPQQFAEEFSIAIVGHFGWDKNLENETPYALCVSFEVLDAEMNIYELLAQAQVEIEPEQEIEV